MNLKMITQKRSTILVVDDEPINRFILEDLIGEVYDLVLLEDAQACIDYFAKAESVVADLILLDVSMPGMDGFELCRLLKGGAKTEQIPIIFLTAKISMEDERLGLKLGAVDYITKPFTESILLARIETHIHLRLTHLRLEESLERLEKERAYIEYIMLSMRDDFRFSTQGLSTLISPVETSNGDLVLSTELRPGHRHILMGDFTGHGLSAAMAGPLVSSLFYTQAEQGIPLEETAMILNRELFKKLPTNIFMGAVFLDWDLTNNIVKIWNCGMPDVLLFRDGVCYQRVASQSLSLGIVDSFFDSMRPVALHCREGDMIFGCSDGVQEVHASSGEAFGDDRIEEVFKSLFLTGKDLSSVQALLEAFAGEKGIEDDATCIQLTISEP
ncbi:MAG: fused response regulator/phosphatase [Gammaproteobacteria bacterium]|nr:fused response regulator/phosphatase [Gammaproteobacteria bacterium]